ncbi:hypothetical protein A7U60_g1314 [Sanghuangporus baumii]|uniref:Fungal-type protein kinase domain-containing protein n=1 Tax=Sanghuangporus baumii TaxID=108892 RepID=A0A9Q5I473_SANBA|nr:hypothetical protein A7U60_g1314 [Sanghuangporus baumii]
MPSPTGAFDKIPEAPKDEREIYEPLASFFNNAQDSGDGALKPDVCGYDCKDIQYVKPKQKIQKNRKRKRVKRNKRTRTTKGSINDKYVANLGLAETLVEVKKSCDPLCECEDHSHEPLKTTIKKSFFTYDNHKRTAPINEPDSAKIERRNLGQSINYPSAAFSRQHRVFYFSVLVVGTRARFLRWDRASGIATASFDYKQQPEILCAFLWRFHLATPVQRGFDPSVFVASRAEEELFKKLIRQHAALQLNISQMDAKQLDEAVEFHYEEGKVTKIQVYDQSRCTVRAFLVSVPLKSPRSVAGRSTRSYWAVELISPSEGNVCFLKDMWRLDKNTVMEEGCVYTEMREKKVNNICDLEMYGDLPDFSWKGSNNQENYEQDFSQEAVGGCDEPSPQCVAATESNEECSSGFTDAVQYTRTTDYINKPWVCDCLREGLKTRIIKRIHCRLVLTQAGYPLKTLKDSRELFCGSRDALEALDSAYQLCGRIHRDITMENIILYRDKASDRRRGLLIDWEFSTLANVVRDPGEYFRSLTWAFIPARVLRDSDYGHQTHEDDMESLFYVVLYGSLRWLPHNNMKALGSWMHSFFDSFEKDEEGRDIGGVEKRCHQLEQGKNFLKKFEFRNKHIKSFFQNGYKYLGSVNQGLDNGYNKSLWTSDNMRNIFDEACKGLCEMSDTEHDRTENDVSDYFEPPKIFHYGTHTALSCTQEVRYDTHETSRPGKRRAEGRDFRLPETKRSQLNNGNRKDVITSEEPVRRRSERLLRKAEKRQSEAVGLSYETDNKQRATVVSHVTVHLPKTMSLVVSDIRMRDTQKLEELQTSDLLAPSLPSLSIPFEFRLAVPLSSQCPDDPVLPCDVAKEVLDPSCRHHAGFVCSMPRIRPLNKAAIPMDIPAARTSKDPLKGPIQEAEINDIHRYAREGRKMIIGPMPVRSFLDEFLPPAPSHKRIPKTAGAFNKVPLRPKDEREIYKVLIAAIDKDKRCPSINFCTTADSYNVHSPEILHPEVCGYDVSLGPFVQDDDPDERTFKSGFKPSLGSAELFALVRKSGDPFCDSHSHDRYSKSIHKSFFAYENHRYQQQSDFDTGKEEERNLGRSVGCISIACSGQHRVFYFAMLIFGTRARFLRWDRAGGIATASFDYRQRPDLLCEFLWRFHHANPVQRGYDPTVIVASRAEEELFRTCVRRHVALQLSFSDTDSEELDEALALHYENGKVMKMQVYDQKRRSLRYYLVSVPLTSPKSADGRSTRAYWAVEMTKSGEGRVRFLKDVWRIDIGNVKEEGVIYGEMGEDRVVNICDLETFGDVIGYEFIDENNEETVNAYQYDRDDEAPNNSRDLSQSNSSPVGDMGAVAGTVQCTRMNDYISQYWVCECLRDRLCLRVYRHTHCRVVLKQAGYPLRTFNGSRELFGGARDALEALDSAYRQCRRIHRDVSLDNIILYRAEVPQPRRGLLVDWEFSTVVDDAGKAIDGLHTGTWAFMPARILRECDDCHQTQEDDMESLFYVVMYGCLRWLPQRHVTGLGRWMYRFFYDVKPGEDGQASGGAEKFIQQGFSGREFLRKFRFENECIQSFFEIGYKYLATTHVAHKMRSNSVLWTMDKFRELCTLVYDRLSSDESTNCDRTEYDVSDYFPVAYDNLPGTRTCLLAAAIQFHVAHGAERARGKRILEEAEDDADYPSNPEIQESGRRSKRRRCEALDRNGGMSGTDMGQETKRMTRGHKVVDIRSADSDSALGDVSARTYNLRSRRLETGNCTSCQGARRSVRLASKRTSAGSKRMRFG